MDVRCSMKRPFFYDSHFEYFDIVHAPLSTASILGIILHRLRMYGSLL
jgi:hypothetical protein